MLDLDCKNEDKSYILDLSFLLKENGFFIGIKYKDGRLGEVPFNFHNYNAIIERMERQFKEHVSFFLKQRKFAKIIESFKSILEVAFLFIVTDFSYNAMGENFFEYCFLFVISLEISLLLKRNCYLYKLADKHIGYVNAVKEYLQNKEKFLFEVSDSEYFYWLNIANIDPNFDKEDMKKIIEKSQSEETQKKLKELKLSYQKTLENISNIVKEI